MQLYAVQSDYLLAFFEKIQYDKLVEIRILEGFL